MKILRPLFSLLAGVVLAIAVGEVLLAHTNLIDNPPGQFRRSATRAFEHKPGFKGHDILGNPIVINSHGMRDREYPVDKPQGVTRIVVLGDSVAFGWGVKAEDTFPKQLELILNQGGPGRYEVLNTGTRGYNTYQELQLLKEVGLRFHPDVVILAYVNNDAEPLEKQAGLISGKHLWLIRLKDFVKEHSYLYAFFRKNLEVARHMVTPQKFSETYTDQFNLDNPGWKASREALKELQGLSGQERFRLILAYCPQFENLKPGESYPPALERIRRQVLGAGRELGIDTIDLLEAVRGQDPEKLKVSTGDSFHPSPYGHQLFAKALAAHLKEPAKI